MGKSLAVRQRMWTLQKRLEYFAALTKPRNRPFASVVARDLAMFLRGVRPVAGETEARARAAAGWLVRAHRMAADTGASYGYFPCEQPPGWQAAYPETTGYIITSLLRYAAWTGDAEAHDRALQMARWEVAVQMPSGAVQGGKLTTPDRQTPAAFNTGMVLDGLVSALSVSPEPGLFDGARAAADFLAADLGEDGYFRTNGQFVSSASIKTYTCLCAWALYRYGLLSGEKGYRDAAVRSAEAAIRQQRENGWFANNCLSRPDAPLLHTIGYALQGVLEVGVLAQRDDFIDSVRRGTRPIIALMRPNGFLPGRLDASWHPKSLAACLTGSAQVAIVCYRLAEVTGERSWREAAERITNFLKACQVTGGIDPDVNGALAGSMPIIGKYQTFGYPNWATKYLLDALMLQHHGTRDATPTANLVAEGV